MVKDSDADAAMNTGNRSDGGRQRSFVLLASLLINAPLIGILVTHWFHARNERHGDYGLAPGLPSIHNLSRELDDTARNDLRQRFGTRRDAIRGAMRDAHESRRGVVEAMRAEPFDADALAGAFAAQRQSDMAVAAAIQSVLVEFARARGADDRQALLRAMSREHRAGRNERAERGETRRSRDPSRRPNNGDGSPSAEPR